MLSISYPLLERNAKCDILFDTDEKSDLTLIVDAQRTWSTTADLALELSPEIP